MKLYAIEVTEEAKSYILEHSDAEPLHVDRFMEMDKTMYLIVNYNGIYSALCWIEADGFAREFDLEEDLVPGEFTEVVEL